MKNVSNKKIKAILFDLVGVLFFKKKDYLPIAKDELNALAIEKLFNHTDDQQLLNDIKDKLKFSDDDIQKALKYIPFKFEKYAPLWTLLPILKKSYKLAIINNGNSIALKYWSKQFNFSFFDEFINSAQVKARKPDPEIYLLTCRKLQVDPHDCLFMDDLQENIDAANNVGMKTIWWNKLDIQKAFDTFHSLIIK